MSGGSYDYVSGRMQDAASTLRSSHASEPHVLALADQIDRIAKVMHDIEWADSCDTSWTPELDAAIREVLFPPSEMEVAVAQAIRVRDALSLALDFAKRGMA